MRASRFAALRFAAPIATVAWLLLATLAFVQVYLLLHEAGHALAAWSVGGTVRTLDARPWSARAHAAYDLPGVSDAARAFVTAAGTLLPYAAWALGRRARGGAVPRRCGVGVVARGGPHRTGRDAALAVGLRAAFPGAAAPVDDALLLPQHAALADRTFVGGPVDALLAEGVAPDGTLQLVLGYDNVAGGPLRLQVVDALGAMHGVGAFGPDTTMGRATSRPRLNVAPGPWSLRLSADDLQGRVRVWDVDDVP